MPAPKGNQFWKLRSSHGAKPIFSNPEELWSAACEYFEWVQENPLTEHKAWHSQGKVITHDAPKMRAMTIDGLTLFLDITRQGLDKYREKEDFVAVVERIYQVIRDQKFAGAAADLLNANIIARDLGLADKSELTGKDGGPIETKPPTDVEMARWIAFQLRKGEKALDEEAPGGSEEEQP